MKQEKFTVEVSVRIRNQHYDEIQESETSGRVNSIKEALEVFCKVDHLSRSLLFSGANE